MSLNPPDVKRQDLRRHIDAAFSIFERRSEEAINRLQNEILFAIAVDELQTKSDGEHEVLRHIMINLSTNRRLANRLVTEAARRELIATWSRILFPSKTWDYTKDAAD